MTNDPLSSANRRFTNLEIVTVEEIRLNSEPVRKLLNSVTSVFRSLDFSEDYQKELGKMLWKLRCTVLYALAPYDHQELELITHCDQILNKAERLPGTRELTEQIANYLLILLEQKINPKVDWIVRHKNKINKPIAIFSMMAMRQSFGSKLITKLPGNIANYDEIISDFKQLNSGRFSTLIIPGTCQYLSTNLFMRLFHLGEYQRIYILLYDGEAFRPKDRLRIPESTLLPGTSKESDPVIGRLFTTESINLDIKEADVDKHIHDMLTNSSNMEIDDGRGVHSRFLLCDNGKGLYVEETERIRIWRPFENDSLIYLYPVNFLEGDFVILEKIDRDELLEQTGDHKAFKSGLDATSEWRTPLNSLLLSKTLDEVATLMMNIYDKPESNDSQRSHKNLKTTISRWAEGHGFGPQNIRHLQALARVLWNDGLLNIECSPEEAAEQWFRDLELLRKSRRTAGMDLSDEIDTLIEVALSVSASPTDGREIELENGMIISLHQIAIISDRVGRVHKSLIAKPN